MTTGTEPTLTNSNDGGNATTPSSAVSASSHGKAGASDVGISREPVVRPTETQAESSGGLISRQQAVSAILDHAAGNCYVLIGFYSDKSGAKLFGVYDDLLVAEDRQRLLDAAGSAYTSRVVKIRRNYSANAEIF